VPAAAAAPVLAVAVEVDLERHDAAAAARGNDAEDDAGDDYDDDDDDDDDDELMMRMMTMMMTRRRSSRRTVMRRVRRTFPRYRGVQAPNLPLWQWRREQLFELFFRTVRSEHGAVNLFRPDVVRDVLVVLGRQDCD
jgi:hypothetical protein